MPIIHLYVPFYVSTSERRQSELYACLQKNLSCQHLDSVCVIMEDPQYQDVRLKGEKLVVVRPPKKSRQTFESVFRLANEDAQKVTNDRVIIIVANADIYFEDASLHILKNLNAFRDCCFALSRWDVLGKGEPRFSNCEGSQDVWMFDSYIRPVVSDFFFGIPRCDHRLAHELNVSGYKVLNPSRQIKTFHLHLEGARTYDNSVSVPGNYRFVPPCDIPLMLLPPHLLHIYIPERTMSTAVIERKSTRVRRLVQERASRESRILARSGKGVPDAGGTEDQDSPKSSWEQSFQIVNVG